MLRRARKSPRQRCKLIQLALACAGLLWVLQKLHLVGSRSDQLSVCLIGNAETQALAERVYEQWGRAFPACFYIWGQDRPSTNRSLDGGHLSLVVPEAGREALAFADGIFAALEHVTAKHTCDYVFSESLSPFARAKVVAEPCRDLQPTTTTSRSASKNTPFITTFGIQQQPSRTSFFTSWASISLRLPGSRGRSAMNGSRP